MSSYSCPFCFTFKNNLYFNLTFPLPHDFVSFCQAQSFSLMQPLISCIFIFNHFFHTIYFDHIFLLSQLFPDPTSMPTQFYILSLSLSLSEKKETKMKIIQESKLEKNTIKKIQAKEKIKMPKQIKMKQKVYQNTTEFIYCWPATLGLRPTPKSSLVDVLHWRKLIFFLY